MLRSAVYRFIQHRTDQLQDYSSRPAQSRCRRHFREAKQSKAKSHWNPVPHETLYNLWSLRQNLKIYLRLWSLLHKHKQSSSSPTETSLAVVFLFVVFCLQWRCIMPGSDFAVIFRSTIKSISSSASSRLSLLS